MAPHPDDEALAASVILQRAVRAGVAVRVVYATTGDDNPWPQRLLEKKWRLNPSDRQRWGRRRRNEALAALRILGVAEENAQFLGLPDQGLTELLLRDADAVVERLAQVMVEWRPNEVIGPAAWDTHPDHSALGVMMRMALSDPSLVAVSGPIQQWTYLVHGRSRTFGRTAGRQLRASEAECALKRSAILCHRTQVKLSRRRFLGYATRPEKLALVEARRAVVGEGSIRIAYRNHSQLCLSLRRQVTPWFAPATDKILLVGTNRHGEARALRLGLPARSGPTGLEDESTGEVVGVARFQGDAFAGRLFIPTDLFPDHDSLFVKFQRRAWFFDEAGWLEIAGPAAKPAKTVTALVDPEAVALAVR